MPHRKLWRPSFAAKKRMEHSIEDDPSGNFLRVNEKFTVEIDNEQEQHQVALPESADNKQETTVERVDTVDEDVLSDGSVDNDELDEALARLDIDRDFNMWSSFRKSIGKNSSFEADESSINKSANNNDNEQGSSGADIVDDDYWQTDLNSYKSRWTDRDEVFSNHYQPSPDEVNEMKTVLVLLGVSSILRHYRGANNPLGSFFRAISGSGGEDKLPSQVDPVSDDKTASQRRRSQANGSFRQSRYNLDLSSQAAIATLFTPFSQSSQNVTADTLSSNKSIVLQRGPVITDQYGESELILLTQGLLLAQTVDKRMLQNKARANGTDPSNTKLVNRHLVKAWLWKDIACISMTDATSLVIVPSNLRLEETNDINACNSAQCTNLIWPKPAQQDLWRQALQKAHYEYTVRSKSVKQRVSSLGWHYNWMRRPAFYLAISNHLDENLDEDLQKDLTLFNDAHCLDEYHGYAPIHYAVRLDHCLAVKILLRDCKVDPNQLDENGNSAMYYAMQDQVSNDISQLLIEHGAQALGEDELNKINSNNKGELFGQVDVANAKVSHKKRVQQVQVEMAENVKLMKERGEKIEQLGSKAQDLNMGAQNYADMARQLKNKTKKRWF